MTRHTLVLEPPPPLTVPAGRCKFGELLRLVAPKKVRHRASMACDRPSARRIQIGMSVSADVCLWHSLVTTERLHGHLVRDLST